MSSIYLLYKTDTHHSYASRDLIGASASANTILRMCHAQADKEGEEISEDQIWNLCNLKQTQGYSGEGEFHFESIVLNKLL